MRCLRYLREKQIQPIDAPGGTHGFCAMKKPTGGRASAIFWDYGAEKCGMTEGRTNFRRDT